MRGPDGIDLKVPQWMLSQKARVTLSSEIVIDIEALRALVTLIEVQEKEKQLLTAGQQETGDPRSSLKEGDRRAPTRTRSPGKSSAVAKAADEVRRQEGNIYDINTLDDQLVFGIKGTLSVVELKVLLMRLIEGAYHKARRGELIGCSRRDTSSTGRTSL